MQVNKHETDHSAIAPGATIKTYRFKFEKNVINELNYFAKLHQFDDRISFKENWTKWTEQSNIHSMITAECDRLSNNGCTGNIVNKMFKSARYYHRKKTGPSYNEELTEDQQSLTDKNDEYSSKLPAVVIVQTKKRNKYNALSRQLLEAMDSHITSQMQTHVKYKGKTENGEQLIIDISPAEAYTHFCKDHKELIEQEYLSYENTEENPKKKIEYKMKKMYKNRYFVLRMKMI